MQGKQLSVMIVALCAITGVIVGGIGLIPMGGQSNSVAASDGSTTPTATPETATAGSAVTTETPEAGTNESLVGNNSTGEVSDCDVVDVDGNDNSVVVNLTDNSTTDDASNTTVHLGCEAGTAPTVDRDLIDIDGDNNTVRVVVGTDKGTLLLGREMGITNDDRSLRIALNCRDENTSADCDAIDVDGNNNSVRLIVQNDTGGQSTVLA